jgi:hypothetical protein
MKTNDILLVGAGATIVYLLWKRSKKAKDVKSLTGGSGATTGAISSGATTGAISTKPEQVYGLELPPNMDLPNLTAGTGTSTEIAVQQGGVLTTPTPAIVTTPVLSVNEALNGIVNVIPKDDVSPPRSFPTLSPCEQKWAEYSAMIKYASQQAYEIAKAGFISKCEGKTTEPILPVYPVKFPQFEVKEDVLPIMVEKTLKEQLYTSANGFNSSGRVINARLYRGVM